MMTDFVNPVRAYEDDLVILGCDPGDEHVGLCWGRRTPEFPHWKVEHTWETTPKEFRQWFPQVWGNIDILALEWWKLYPDKAALLIGSDMPTSRLIGWIDWEIERQAPHIQVFTAFAKDAIHGPVPGLLRRFGIKPVSPPGANRKKGSTGDHQRSAELHLWYQLIKNNLIEGMAV